MKRSSRQKVTQELQAIDRSSNPKAKAFKGVTPKTENQKFFVESLKEDTICVCAGYAGTGKTLLACSHAAEMLYTGKIKKIVLIRAYQPLAGRSIGLLPGEIMDKLKPYYQQMLDYLEDFLGKPQMEIHLKRGSIEICSLETIRGRSWDDTCVLVDEAQNLFIEEIQALTTRVGTNSQLILMGDDSGLQSDITDKQNGLAYLLGLVEKYDIPSVGVTYLDIEDILRSEVTKSFVIAFDKELQEAKRKNKRG